MVIVPCFRFEEHRERIENLLFTKAAIAVNDFTNTACMSGFNIRVNTKNGSVTNASFLVMRNPFPNRCQVLILFKVRTLEFLLHADSFISNEVESTRVVFIRKRIMHRTLDAEDIPSVHEGDIISCIAYMCFTCPVAHTAMPYHFTVHMMDDTLFRAGEEQNLRILFEFSYNAAKLQIFLKHYIAIKELFHDVFHSYSTSVQPFR